MGGDAVSGNSTWTDGDWNCDGDFTSLDIVLAFWENDMLPAAIASRKVQTAANIVLGYGATR
jgi:hypothetical protein